MKKLYLFTKYDKNGKLIFQKEKSGNKYVYPAMIDKVYVLRTKEEIINDIEMYGNVKLVGDKIYPIEVDKKVREEEIPKSSYIPDDTIRGFGDILKSCAGKHREELKKEITEFIEKLYPNDNSMKDRLSKFDNVFETMNKIEYLLLADYFKFDWNILANYLGVKI